MSDAQIASPMSGSSARVITGAIAVSVAFVMELTLVPLLLPAIQEQFGLSISQLAWVFNSYGVAVAIGVLLGGWFGDAFNAKRVFSVGVFLFASGSVVVAYAQSYETILAGRILQGLGGGVFSPLIPMLLTGAVPQRPGKILIVWGSIAGYVAALAPFFYGHALSPYGWDIAFVVFAIVAVVSLVAVSRSEGSEEPAGQPKPRPSYARLLECREIWVIFAYVFCTYGSITYYLFRLPLWLEENGMGVASIGLMLSVMWLSFSLVSTFLRNKVDQPRIRWILLVAPILIAVGFPLAYYCEEIACIVASACLIGSALACSNAPSTQLILAYAPKGVRAISASLDITFARIGGVATVALLAQTIFAYAVLAILFLSAAALFCAIIALRTFDHDIPHREQA